MQQKKLKTYIILFCSEYLNNSKTEPLTQAGETHRAGDPPLRAHTQNPPAHTHRTPQKLDSKLQRGRGVGGGGGGEGLLDKNGDSGGD